jgi:hypothetical protein
MRVATGYQSLDSGFRQNDGVKGPSHRSTRSGQPRFWAGYSVSEQPGKLPVTVVGVWEPHDYCARSHPAVAKSDLEKTFTISAKKLLTTR